MVRPLGIAVRLLLALLTFATGMPCAAADDVEPTFRHEPLKKLLAELKDKNATVRRLAATTLGMPDGTEGKGGPRPKGDLWPAILALVEALKDDDAMVRVNSVKSIGLLSRYRGIPEKTDPRNETVALAVIASLKDAEDTVRSQAAASLATIPVETKAGVKALAHLLKDGEPKVRAAAAEGTRGVRPMVEAVPALAGALADKVAAVRLAAANSLAFARLEARGAVQPLIDTLKDPDAPVVAAAATALGAIGPEARLAVPALADLVADRASPNRATAVSALGTIRQNPDVAVPVLIGALSSAETRPAATYSLGYFGAQAKMAAPALLAIGRDDQGAVRPEVLDALSQVEPGGAALHELLFAALRDPNPFVRGAGVDFCSRGEAGTAVALPVLIELFKADNTLRNRVAYAFGAMGAEAKPAVPMLLEMVRDPETNPNLRRILIIHLRQIDPESVKAP